MKVYVLKQPPSPLGDGNTLATFICNDDNLPPDFVVDRVRALGYHLAQHVPNSPRNGTEWDEMVGDEIRAYNNEDLEDEPNG